MNNSEKKYVEKVMESYKEKEITKIDELKQLDKKVKKPVTIFAYVYGSIAALIFGLGMCMAMKSLPAALLNAIASQLLMVLGIIIGVFGMLMCGSTYFIYKKMLQSRKDKYGKQIIELSNELLNK